MTTAPFQQLTDFLTDRLREDDQTAANASDSLSWTSFHNPPAQGGATVGIPVAHHWIASDLTPGGADHIARHDPQRVLRQTAATRAHLDQILSAPHTYSDEDNWYSCSQATDRPWGSTESGPPGSGCSDPQRQGKPCDCGLMTSQLRQLRTLAQIYQDHPDYPYPQEYQQA